MRRIALAFGFAALAAAPAPGARGERLTPETVVGTAAGAPVTLREIDRDSAGALTALWRSIDGVKRLALERRIDELLRQRAGALPPAAPSPEVVQVLLQALSAPAARRDAELFADDLARRDAARRAQGAQAGALRGRAAIRRFLPQAVAPGEPVFPATVAELVAEPGAEPVPVLDAELERAARLELYHLRGRVFAEAERGFRARADARLLSREARRRKLSSEALEAALAAQAAPVGDEEVAAYYAAHRSELDGFRPERIRGYLEFRARAAAREVLLERLRADHPPRFALVAPAPPRFPEEAGERPPGAPLVLTVFSNFRCARCAETERALGALAAEGSLLRIARRHLFPDAALVGYLDAVAAACADAAGAGEAFRATLVAALESGAHPEAAALGRAAVPNRKAFEACRRAPATRSAVLADLDAAERIGFREEPSFLVGDLPAVGFQGRERLLELVERESESTPGSGTQ